MANVSPNTDTGAVGPRVKVADNGSAVMSVSEGAN